jgi:hypothetical protein
LRIKEGGDGVARPLKEEDTRDAESFEVSEVISD